MATTIIIKNSGTTGTSPLISDLSFGEIAINYADGRLFYKDGTSTIKYFNANPDFGSVKSVNIDPGGTGLTFTTGDGNPITTSGTFTVGGTLGVFNGGTGASNPTDAINNLLPSQASFSGRVLSTDGTNIVWKAFSGSDVISGLGYTPVNRAGDTMQGTLTLHADPVSALDAATKQYVDNLASGLNVHLACAVASTANLNGTYNNGSNGIGATLTGVGQLTQLDGHTLIVGDRILLKNQTDKKQNGIYVLSANNPNWVLMRATDFDNSFAGEVSAGDFTFIQNGTTLAGTQWIMITPGTISLGTSAIEWSQFGSVGNYIAGNGISIVENTISNTGVLSATAGQNISITGSTGNITVGFSGVLPVESGGTGAETPAAARAALLPSQNGNANKVLITDGSDVSWSNTTPIAVATSTILGGVKIGDNVTVAEDGTISVAAPFGGNYTDLTNAPTKVSDFTNDVGFVKFSELAWSSISGTPTGLSYFQNDINYALKTDITWENVINRPTNVSEFTNDAQYVTQSNFTWENLNGTVPDVGIFGNAAGYITTTSLTWNNITDKPDFATVATTGSLDDLVNVDLTTVPPTDGQLLGYNSVMDKWIPVDDAAGIPGGTDGQLQYNNNGSFAGVSGVTATADKVAFESTDNISIGGGTSGQVLSTDGAGNVSWTSISEQSGPLVFTTSGSYRTLTGYQENGSTSPVRVAEFFGNKLRLTLATFTPTISATISPASPSWDQPITSFAVSVVNPDDITDQYISAVRSITATSGSISALNTFSAGVQSATPAGTVDWTQTFTTDADSFIRPTSTTIAGGNAAGTIAFNFYNGTSTAEYMTSTASISVNWATPTLGVALSSLTGNTFLQSYNSVAYTVTVTGMSSTSNYANSVTAVGGTTSSATASGTFTFTDPIHKNNTATTRTVSVSTTFTRPASVTGTSYTANLSATTASASATFTYPSFWLFTTATSVPPTASNIVNETAFAAGVTALGSQVKVFAGNVNNTESTPRAFWFAVRTSASQPTSFKTGPTSSLLSDVSVTTGNTVSLQPTTPPAGYVAEGYTLYGITLQPGTTYVSIS
jgi:hypothetical protein